MKLLNYIALAISLISCCQAGLHPVVLVPGDGGSQMEAKLDKPSVVHYLCDKKTNDYFNIWLNLELLVPLVIDCWIDNLRLVYNTTTRRTENSPGVDIRVPGFGNTTVVEFLDPSKASPGLYFKTIVEASLLPIGYERNITIRGAPYDFRKAPNELEDFLVQFKQLIQTTYSENGNKSVVLICHSMGSPMSQYLLLKQTAAWKKKYVRAMITVGGVWGGSVKALKVFAAGDDLGAYVLPSKTLRREQRTNPSTAWLLPSVLYWDNDDVLVSLGGKRNYTVADYADFFKDINYPVGYEMYQDTYALLGNREHPGVEVHCLHGAGVSTVESLNYKDATYFPDKPTLSFGNGDGTVNIRSLRGCQRWDPTSTMKRKKISGRNNSTASKIASNKKRRSNLPKVFHREFSGADHMAVLTDVRILSYIKTVMQGINSE